MAEQKCNKCKLILPPDRFYNLLGGKYKTCKSCESKQAKLRRAKDPDKHLAYHRAWRERNRARLREQRKTAYWANKEKIRDYRLTRRKTDPIRAILESAKRRAVIFGVPFSICRDDIVIPDRCPVLGIKFGPNNGRGYGFSDSMSLDRIDPNKGYIPGNVQVMSRKANAMKSNATREELLSFARWILETSGEVGI